MSNAIIYLDQLLTFIKTNIDLRQKPLYNNVFNLAQELRDKLQASITSVISRRTYWESLLQEAEKLQQYVLNITKTYGQLPVDQIVLDQIQLLIQSLNEYLQQVGTTGASSMQVQEHTRTTAQSNVNEPSPEVRGLIKHELDMFQQDLENNFLKHAEGNIKFLQQKIKECEQQSDRQKDDIQKLFDEFTKIKLHIDNMGNEISNINQQITEIKLSGKQNKNIQQLTNENQKLLAQVVTLEKRLLKVEENMDTRRSEYPPIQTGRSEVIEFHTAAKQSFGGRIDKKPEYVPTVEMDSVADCLQDTKRTRK